MRAAAAIAAAVCVLGPAAVSTAAPVARMDAATLTAGADAVVEGRVIAIDTTWNRDRTGFETRIQVEVSLHIWGGAPDVVTIVQPGGELEGARHVIVGMPAFSLGESARLYLRQTGAASYRVYGWSQGKVPLPIVPAQPQPAFELNGMQWEPGQIPVQWLFGSAGSDDLALADARAAVEAAFQTWADVPCSSLSFNHAGDTDLGLAVDQMNVITWIESDWIFGEEAAGAASLFFGPGQPPTVDVALNGDNFTWADGVPSVGPATQDVQGVLTHELGHFSGLSHTQSSLDTMYFSWTPWQSQRSLSADDKLGLCELYPTTGDECADSSECDEGATCESYAMGTLCTPQPDPIGASCDRDRIECEDFCVFTSFSLTSGFCSMFCDDEPCPDGFECRDASAGSNPVRVCFPGSGGGSDAGAIGTPCADNGECPMGQFCGATGTCTLECREDFDCNDTSLECSGAGQCVPASSGCGCRAANNSGGLAALLLLFLGGYVSRRRTRPQRRQQHRRALARRRDGHR